MKSENIELNMGASKAETEVTEKQSETVGVSKEPQSQKEQLQKKEWALKAGIAFHKAMKEYDDVRSNMIARGQGDQLIDIYGKKVDVLYEEYSRKANELSKEDYEKVQDDLKEELMKIGISLESSLNR